MFSSDKGDPPPPGIKPPTATGDSEAQTTIKPPTATGDPETPGDTEATGDTPIVISGG
jgi:hypothetical protein